MLLFSHLGIGSRLASPWGKGLPRKWLLAGTMLPDLVDKPLYYGSMLATGRKACEIGLISSTRTFGHTGVALIALAAVSVWRRSKLLAALAMGSATHLFLDAVGDHFVRVPGEPSSAFMALVFPFQGPVFACFPHSSLDSYWHAQLNPFFVTAELVGILLLSWDQWKLAHERDIWMNFRASPKKIWRKIRRAPQDLAEERADD